MTKTSIVGIDLCDPDLILTGVPHETFARLRREGARVVVRRAGRTGLLVCGSVRRRPDGQPRLGEFQLGRGRVDSRHDRCGPGGQPTHDAEHGPTQAHALPPSGQQGFHAADDRSSRGLAHAPGEDDRRRRDRARRVRLRHRHRRRTARASDRRHHGCPHGGPPQAPRLVEPHDGLRGPGVQHLRGPHGEGAAGDVDLRERPGRREAGEPERRHHQRPRPRRDRVGGGDAPAVGDRVRRVLHAASRSPAPRPPAT